ncbi:MAG: PH domain-containing protein [Bacteroidia bacterium]
MREQLKNFLNEQQDPKSVEKILGRVKDLLTAEEQVEYIAVQKKPAVNLSPDCVALTTKRVIFCRPKNLGFSMEFQDFMWKDVVDCHMKEEIFGAEFNVKSVTGNIGSIDYLPKAQARKLYQIAQGKEEQQREIRRERELEDKRAAAGGVTVTATIPNQTSESSVKKDDPLATLQNLKMLLENGLLTQQEFDTKKAEVIARL